MKGGSITPYSSLNHEGEEEELGRGRVGGIKSYSFTPLNTQKKGDYEKAY